MCDTGTPMRERAMCGCYRVRTLLALAAGAIVVGGVLWNAAAAVLAVVAVVAAVAVFALRRTRGNGGLGWLVHRTHHWVADEPQAEPEPAPEVPWYDRARI